MHCPVQVKQLSIQLETAHTSVVAREAELVAARAEAAEAAQRQEELAAAEVGALMHASPDACQPWHPDSSTYRDVAACTRRAQSVHS
jgi:hypothetical protein